MPELRSAEADRIASRDDAWSEVQRLRSLNRDLISLLAQPAIGTGQMPAGVIKTLVEVLSSMLRVDLAYARVTRPGEAAIEAASASARPEIAQRAPGLGAALERWLKAETWNTPITIENPLERGEMRLFVGRFGLHEDSGVVAVGSRRQSFPNETETLLFRVAINQAVIGFQGAQLLQEHQRVERLALEAASLGTWDYDPLTGDMTWSDRCKELFGLPPDAKVDYQVFLAGLHPEDRERTHQAVQRALAAENGGRLKIESRTLGPQDEIERWVSAAGRAFFDGSGRAVRVVLTVRDITERKRAEAERELFLAVLGHDLRDPLGAIQMAAQIALKRVDLAPAIARPIGLVASSAAKMRRLIEQLLDCARMRLGRGIELHPRQFDFEDLCRQVVAETELAYGRTVSFRSRGDLVGCWDYDRISEAVANLVGNALEHGVPEKPVEVYAAGGERHVVLEVRNQGEPIPEAERAHLFDPFRRGTRRGRGLGLGLYITQQIVAAHQGTIRIESRADEKGTTVTVRLPSGQDEQLTFHLR